MLKVVNYFRERISSEIFDWVLNTSPIFKLLRQNLSKFVSYQNKLLARLNLEEFTRFTTFTCLGKNLFFSSIFFSCISEQERAPVSYVSPYHNPVSAVASKRRRSSRPGPSKMEDLPEQEDKRFISKSNKKRSS